MDDLMIFQFVGETVKNATDAFVTPAASQLITAIQALTLTGVTLYIVLQGYAISTGAVESPFWTFIKQSLKIGIIAFFALTVDGYISHVVTAINGLEEGLSSAMQIGGAGATNIYETLDKNLSVGFKLAGDCFKQSDNASWNEFGAIIGWTISGVVIIACSIVIGALGAATIIVAKFSLAVMLALGPLFIVCLMFPITSKFFDSWFAQVMNYILTIVIMAIIMTFAIKAFTAYVEQSTVDANDVNPLFVAFQILGVTGILCFIIYQAGGMASGLAGGVSMASMGIRHLTSPVTGTARAMTGAGRMLNPQSTRYDMTTGRMVSQSRLAHAISGNTAINPAYRQHVMSNIGKNWGRAKGGGIKAAPSSSGGSASKSS